MNTATITLGSAYPIPDEERAGSKEPFDHLLGRLNHQSVVKHFDAYADIPWEDPEFRIDSDDTRWELAPDDPLGSTFWYRSQAPAVRSRLGLYRIATSMKIGCQFESVLKRGLLEFASTLPNNSPVFRYAYHEVIEEAQHSLMFQEFVNRTGFDIAGMAAWQRLGSRQVVRFGRTFPELFLVFVLGGEDPIDHVQRTVLHSGHEIHPLLRRVMQIHITEEARHICFAREYLRRQVPQLSVSRRFQLAVRAPVILAIMAQTMMRPSPDMQRRFKVPASVMGEAFTHNPRHREATLAALAKTRALCEELGIMRPWLWQRLGVWGEPEAATA